MKKQKILFFAKSIVILLVLFSPLKTNAQIENSFEVSINVGVISMQSDYGERGNIKSSLTGNIGYTTSISLYKNFYDRYIKWNSRTNWIQEHLKLKAGITHTKINLNHYGIYSEGKTNSSILLRAMHGESSITNFEGGVEYHLLSLTDFSSEFGTTLLSPYVSFGGAYGISNANVTSDLGNINENSILLIDAYKKNAIYIKKEEVFSFYFGAGTRLKLSKNTELVFDTKWQYYFSDKIDGLSPKIDANKNNDWTYQLSLGIVIYLY